MTEPVGYRPPTVPSVVVKVTLLPKAGVALEVARTSLYPLALVTVSVTALLVVLL